MMVEKERWGMNMGTNKEDTSGHEKSEVRLAWLGLEDLELVFLPTGSGVVPAVSGMINWVAHNILLSPSFSWWFPPSPLISLFLYHHLRTRSYVIPIYLSMQWSSVNTEYNIQRVPYTPSTAYTKYSIHQVQHTPSTAYTKYSIHQVQHTLSTASSHDRLSPAPSQSLISRHAVLYLTLYIATVTS